MTKRTPTHKFLRRVLELDKSATVAPWSNVQGNFTFEEPGFHGCSASIIPEGSNGQLIAFYRSAAPKMARALDVVLAELDGQQCVCEPTSRKCLKHRVFEQIEALLTDSTDSDK